MVSRSLVGDLAYLKELFAAGFEGVASARNNRNEGVPALDAVWKPTAMGAAIGALGTRLVARQKSVSSVALGGLLGSLLGCGVAAAWASRGLIGPATRGAARRVNAVRDARWLTANPIDYA